MGNGLIKCTGCLTPAPHRRRRRHDSAAVVSERYFPDEGIGHSFCYVPPEQQLVSESTSKVHHHEETTATTTTATTFGSISGASVSANTSTTSLSEFSSSSGCSVPASFDCSDSFAAVPLQPIPRLLLLSGPLSGPMERGFMSGPIERGFMSGPIDPREAASDARSNNSFLRRSFSHGGARKLRKAFSKAISFRDNPGDAKANPPSLPPPPQSLHWAEGRAGEDRVHVVISEERRWVFVGIYDGFNGPDAPDYLLSRLYPEVEKRLKGLLWDEEKLLPLSSPTESEEEEEEKVNHTEVLEAMSMALRRTEESFLETADNMVGENPELALMGSCVLVMLMKSDDVYFMNVGDSRGVLGRKDLGMIDEGEEFEGFPSLQSLQLTSDHSTAVDEEIRRIMEEHPDDPDAISNDRVKGSLKVTRAFGAGFLKQPKWNNALLEMFRIDYVGSSPYITCNPSLRHHKLGGRDRFLVLSSDGLYQYFTNEEAVAEVELFIAAFPDGDPAQHLVEEVIFRAARKAGMDFHELLEIPQGDRRRYHDDVSIIIISFEGRIWRSSV